MPLVTIDKLAFGGAGLGHVNGKACFVPYTAPGDLAEVAIVSEKKSYSTGLLQELKNPSALRVSPVCPLSGICGGCNWQHIDYGAQCRWKEQIFSETMWRMARIEKERINALLSAEEPFYYRQRIQLKVHWHQGRLLVGFYRNASHYVVDIHDNCPIASPYLNNAIPELREIIVSSGEPERIPQVDLAAGEDGAVAALFHYIGRSPETFAAHLAARQGDFTAIKAVFMRADTKQSFQSIFGSEQLGYSLPDIAGKEIEFGYSIDTFSQVNFRQNRALSASFLGMVRKIPAARILDIYCGNGNFSLLAAAGATEVVGIEGSEKSVAFARENGSRAGIDNARFFSGDAESRFDALAASGRKFDLLVLDPPRSGAHDLVKKLGAVGPSHVIYVSCDPVTLARDLAVLQKTGFRVAHSQPVDMFPQTYHIESITLLERI